MEYFGILLWGNIQIEKPITHVRPCVGTNMGHLPSTGLAKREGVKYGYMIVDLRPSVILDSRVVGVNSAYLNDVTFATMQVDLDLSYTEHIDCDPNVSCFPTPFASNVWDPLQPLNSTISVSVEPDRPRRMWQRNAWKQLKDAVLVDSPFDYSEMLIDNSRVLELASDYLSTELEDILQASFATIVSTGKILRLLEPFAKKLRNFVNRVLKASTLYGGKAFLVPVFQSVSVETAAHDHVLHIESIALARDHSVLESIQKITKRLEYGRVDLCKILVHMCLENSSGPVLPTFSLCASPAPSSIT